MMALKGFVLKSWKKLVFLCQVEVMKRVVEGPSEGSSTTDEARTLSKEETACPSAEIAGAIGREWLDRHQKKISLDCF